jgi:hypothetical protein
VLIVYETADLSRLSRAQANILTAAEVRAYLNARCATGPDGKTAEWRIWDQNVDTAAEAPIWRAAMARKRDKLPWLIISTGKSGYEGPLPASVDDTLKLLKQFGG